MKISSPELTAFDLLRYGHAAGNINSIATVLSDLASKLRRERLAKLAPSFERTCVQRLGYLLDFIKHQDIAEPLLQQLEKEQPVPWVELEPARKFKAAAPADRNSRWNVVVRKLPELDA